MSAFQSRPLATLSLSFHGVPTPVSFDEVVTRRRRGWSLQAEFPPPIGLRYLLRDGRWSVSLIVGEGSGRRFAGVFPRISTALVLFHNTANLPTPEGG